MATTSFDGGQSRLDAGWWVKHGVISGIVGVIGMMVLEMGIAMLMGMDASMPPRMIAGMVLGRRRWSPRRRCSPRR